MLMEMEIPKEVMEKFRSAMLEMAKEAYVEAGKQEQFGEYMTKAEAGKYLHVSNATLSMFIKQGLQVSIIGNIQRISKQECDRFMQEKLR